MDFKVIKRYDKDGNIIKDVSKFVPRPNIELIELLNDLYNSEESVKNDI